MGAGRYDGRRPMLESAITRSILKYLKKLEPDAFAWKIHGGPMQKAGMPDICVIYRDPSGNSVGFFEVKQPGKKQTKLQCAVAKKLEAAGAWVEVVTSLDEVKEWF